MAGMQCCQLLKFSFLPRSLHLTARSVLFFIPITHVSFYSSYKYEKKVDFGQRFVG